MRREALGGVGNYVNVRIPGCMCEWRVLVLFASLMFLQ
jgi:hypothetical protein